MSKAQHYTHVCPYCYEKTQCGHLVPASMGEPSFTVCRDSNRDEQENGMPKEHDWLKNPPPEPMPLTHERMVQHRSDYFRP